MTDRQRCYLGILAGLFGVALALTSPAVAQEGDATSQAEGPQATTATYRDWTLRCQSADDGPAQRVCEIAQAVRERDGDNVLAQIVVGRPSQDAPVIMVVQLPAGVWLPAGVQLVPANASPITAQFTRCVQLCVADVELDDEALDTLRAATEPARLSFQDGARRSIELPVSLMGFTNALNASLN